MELTRFSEIADAPSRARILQLHPVLRQSAVDAVLDALSGMKNGLRVTYALRTFAEQDKLYAKGRTAPGGVVTKAKGGQSYHNYGLALDFVLLHADGKVSYNVHEDLDLDGIADWNEVADAFKRHGWEWGGEWQFKDNPHVQKTFGHNWRELLALHDAKKVDAQGYVILDAA